MTIADDINALNAIASGSTNPESVVRKPKPAPWTVEAILGPELHANLATIVPRAAAGVASMPFDLWNLAGKGLDWATGGENVLPGAQGAQEIGDAIHQPVKDFTKRITGKDQNPSLIDGTAGELAASWGSLGLMGVLRAPAAITRQLDAGITALEAGKGVAARTGEYAVKGLEVLSPVVMRNPTAGVVAANVAVPGAIGVGLELAFPTPKPEQLDEEAKRGTDAAVQGAEVAAPGVAAVNPVQASFSTGNGWLDAALIGVGGVAAIAAMKRDVAKRILGGTGEESTMLGTADAVRSQVVDRTAGMKEWYRAALEEEKTPNWQDLSKRWEHKVDSSHGAAIDTKLMSVFNDGNIPGSNIKLPPVRDLYTAKMQLDPQRYETLVKGMNADVELANRQAIAQRDLKIGVKGQYGTASSEAAYLNAVRRGGLDEGNLSYHMWDQKGTDLVNARNAMSADPELAKIAATYDTISKRMLDYAVEQRFLSPKERTKILEMNPKQFFTDVAQGRALTDQLWSRQVRGGNLTPGDPFEALPRYIEGFVRQVEWNKNVALWTSAMRNMADNGNAVAKQVLGRRSTQPGAHSSDKFVRFRDRQGNLDWQEIKDPIIRNALSTGADLSRLHALSGLMARSARVFESSATGSIAAAFLQPFSHISALYNAVIGTSLRERGTRVGYVDKLLQDAGFKPGLPGDPTVIVDSAFRAIHGMSAVAAKQIANALHDSVVKGGVLSNALTPQSAERVATALANHYKRSWVHAFQQEGLLGPAAAEGINRDGTLKHVQQRMAAANMPMSVTRDTYQFVRGILDGLGEYLHVVSSSPTASVYSMNKQMHPDLRARAVREFAGDPSRAGAFMGKGGQVVGKLTAATPWGNVYVQSMDKFMRSWKKQPGSVAMGLSTMVGLPTISAALWNASLGPEFSDYQYNKRTADRKASSIYVGLPGLDPASGLEIPIDPLARPYKLGAELLTGYNLGLMDGSLFNPESDSMRQAFIEMVRSSWGSAGEGSVGRSVIEQSVLPPIPTAVGASAALLGKDVRSYIDVKDIKSRTDTGFTDSDARDPNRTVFGLNESAQAESVIRKLGANVGALAYNMLFDAGTRIESGDPVLANSWRSLKQGFNDSTRQVSGLWGSFQAVSPSHEAAGQAVKQKIKGLREIAEATQAMKSGGALTMGGVTGTTQRGFQELLGVDKAIAPNDPKMIAFGQYINMRMPLIERQFLGPMKTLYEQRQSIQGSTKYSPERKRSIMNILSNEIIEKDRELLQMLQQMETQASNMFGMSVRFDKMSKGKGTEQFTLP